MKVLFVTGSGVSANAGIDTYRDGTTSWRDPDLEKKSHATRYGNHLDELWDKFWGPVGEAMTKAHPTHTHKAITEFQKKYPSMIATQNIDTLHEKAGSHLIEHVHGSAVAICMRCKSDFIQPWTGKGAPQCADCGSRKTRPDVVLFGEGLNVRQVKRVYDAARNATHIVAIGTSLNVFPIANVVIENMGAKNTFIISKHPTPYDKWAVAINKDCDEVIDYVLEDIERELDTA